ERSIEPHRAFREHHLVGRHNALVELTVAVGVLEPNDPMWTLSELLVGFVVRSGRIRDVETSLVIEVRADRSIDEGRSGDALYAEARMDSQRRSGGLGRLLCTRGRQKNNDQTGKHSANPRLADLVHMPP